MRVPVVDKGVIMVRQRICRVAVWLGLFAVLAGPVIAQDPGAERKLQPGLEYCGQNGLVRFSFVEGDSLVSVLQSAEPTGGVTTVDVWAWLTEVDRISRNGYALLGIGGFEITLEIVGAEAVIVGQDFPDKHLNVGRQLGECIVGLDPGYKIRKGMTQLAHWTVMFQGRPQDVAIRLAPGPTWTCGSNLGCHDHAPPAVYLGTEATNLERSLFGAGFVPAWLNPSVEPDLTPIGAGAGWRDLGLCDDP